MVVLDCVGTREQREPAAEVSEDCHDAIPMFRRHIILVSVKIAQVFDTDAILVCAFDSGRNVIDWPANRHQPVRKRREILSYFGETSLDYMRPFHVSEQEKKSFTR